MSDLRESVITQTRPLPQPGLDNVEFYEAAKRGELRFQRCSDCGAWRHYPRPACPECQSRNFSWELASGRGRVFTWAIVHGPTLPAFRDELPYNVVDVLLDEGVHFQSQVLDCPPDEIYAEMPVEAVFVPASEDITLVKFRRR
ncbi:MAG: Zn-ribbon domain-containing OB-fold protein [Proteobacteria bacterium]|nr:Zn-ribbon domain-containing OB-fold protein [Pseudomonadota bacterium]